MRKTILASALLASFVAAPTVAFAEDAAPAAPAFTSNVTLASEYIYRGIGQTNRKPAIQGGFDYAHSSGLYVGTWGSNISWLSDQAAGTISSSMEWDFYGGYKTAIDDFGVDVGVLQYFYPGSGYGAFAKSYNPNTTEGYLAGSWKTLTLKYSRAFTDLFGATDSKGSGYLDLTGTYDLGDGFGVVGHVGRQKIQGGLNTSASYTDYKVGVTKDFSGTVAALSYITTNGSPTVYTNAFGKDLSNGRVLFSVTRTF